MLTSRKRRPAGPKRGGAEPTVASLQGLFRKAGESLKVIAVEQGAAEVVMVVDRAIGRELETFRRRKTADLQGNGVANLPFWRFSSTLEPNQRLRFIIPEAEERTGVGAFYNLFPETPTYTSADAGVYFLISMHDLSRQHRTTQRLSDAVAVAGMIAAGTRRPRAVVLVLGRKSEDSSKFPPELTRGYLEALRVPLYVWYPRKKLPKERRAWGKEVVGISSLGKLEAAVSQLSHELERQWIVWLDGVHLPQTVELAPGGEGIQLVYKSLSVTEVRRKNA